jgi:isopenicillin N synthase-like dioxygenase
MCWVKIELYNFIYIPRNSIEYESHLIKRRLLVHNEANQYYLRNPYFLKLKITKLRNMAAIDAASGYDRKKELKEFDESKIGVKGLSDSGITSIPRFFVHPPETLSDLKSSSTCGSIPVIDLSGVNSAAHRQKIVEQVKEAAATWGFFQVINHGAPVPELEETINAIKTFHEQPHEAKSKYYKRNEGPVVAYTTNNDLYRAKAAAWHDYLQVWMAPTPSKMEDIPEVCRDEAVAWDKRATEVAETLMELLSQGLGMEAGKLKELKFADTRLFVGICYPYCPQPDLTLGITPHTDPGFLTVLMQNHVPGLQVKHGDGWVNVNPVPGGLIINVGDFLQVIKVKLYILSS